MHEHKHFRNIYAWISLCEFLLSFFRIFVFSDFPFGSAEAAARKGPLCTPWTLAARAIPLAAPRHTPHSLWHLFWDPRYASTFMIHPPFPHSHTKHCCASDAPPARSALTTAFTTRPPVCNYHTPFPSYIAAQKGSQRPFARSALTMASILRLPARIQTHHYLHSHVQNAHKSALTSVH